MNDIFLRACYGQEVEYTPVWIMRQAGRYLPEYQALRRQTDFLGLCKNPQLAAEATLQPVDILGVDAAILFSDILVPVEAMGMKLRFLEKKGPVLSRPVRKESDLKRLKIIEPKKDVPFVLETIKILRRKLRKKVPLIGFSGAPFTVATYMIEGGTSKNFVNTKRMMFSEPELFHSLMDFITDNTIRYLKAQVRAGAQALQVFDSWAGAMSPEDYRNFSRPYVMKVLEALKDEKVPVIYFANGCAGLLEEIRSLPAHVFGIDWRVDIGRAITKLGRDKVVQGNLDPTALFADRKVLETKVRTILDKAKRARGHIFNLGHGILPETPPEAAKTLVELVHLLSKRQ